MLARVLLATLLTLGAFAAPPARAQAQAAMGHDESEIRALFARMEAAWNRGDFRGYMDGFENPGVVFVSGGRVQDGWQGTLDHYVHDYGGAPERRGTLHFYDMRIEMVAPDAALLIGHYHLERPQHAQEGINTRLLRKIGGHWLITMNHVSSYDPAAAPADQASPTTPRQ